MNIKFDRPDLLEKLHRINNSHALILGAAIEERNKWNTVRFNQPYQTSEDDLRGIKVKSADLRKIDLSHCWVEEALFNSTDLRYAIISGSDCCGTTFRDVDLRGANLSGSVFTNADFNGSNLQGANLSGSIFLDAHLVSVDLTGANLSGSDFSNSLLHNSNLSNCDLSKACLDNAFLRNTNLYKANLTGTSLCGASLEEARFIKAKLLGTNLSQARMIRTDLSQSELAGCKVHGISVWDVITKGAVQSNLVITGQDEPIITVDNIKVAQFVHLLLNNSEIRDVIDEISGKGVLILGRFTVDRLVILKSIAEFMRKKGLLPIMMDFEEPRNRNFTETVRILAALSKFVIADLTYPRCTPHEAASIVPFNKVPFVPIVEVGNTPYSMFADLSEYPWVLDLVRYADRDDLLLKLQENILVDVDNMVSSIKTRRQKIASQYK